MRVYFRQKTNNTFSTCHLTVILGKFWEKACFSKILQNQLFDKLSEPSQAKLFDRRLESKTELSKPSLGSGATLQDMLCQSDLIYIGLCYRRVYLFLASCRIELRLTTFLTIHCGLNIGYVFWRAMHKTYIGHETWTKIVWEKGFTQILGFPLWPKKLFKVGLSK